MSGKPEEGTPAVTAHLILMSRAPVAGRTKTRLAPPLTAEQARDFHAACLQDLIGAAAEWQAARQRAGKPVRCHLVITPPGSHAAFSAAGVSWPPSFRIAAQRGGTLGERMAAAMDDARAGDGSGAEPAVPAVLVGSDLPLLGADQWEAALAALERYPVVFGPTPDGGYYLVASRVGSVGLPDVSGWGGAAVLEDSERALAARGMSAGRIETLPDVDTWADREAVLGHPRARKMGQRRSLRLLSRWPGA